MAVTSGTLAGVNTWTFSGAVTDAEIKTAWAGLVVNGVYVLNRAIYLDDTADISGVTGGMLVDFGTQVLPAIIFHDSGDRTKQVFNNFTFLQRTGLSVANRSLMLRGTNGTILTAIGDNGLSQKGGGFVYGVVGNSGVGDSRYLNELPFGSLEGVTIYSQEFTEQELQVIAFKSTQLKGLTFEKAYGFPQLGTPTGNNNVVVYRSTQNTQSLDSGGLIPIRLFPSGNRYASVCYVDSYITRNNADITTRLISTFGTNASNLINITILNNYTRESWFGVSKTTIPVLQWYAGNTITGGVLKKLQFVGGDGATIRAYDSRSTTAAQKCSFAETGFIDFLDSSLAPTTDATGKITLVHVGATASGATGATAATITRYTDQRYTFQKFGFRVSVTNIDMTAGGDNDLSAFTPVIPATQTGLVRTQAEINTATTITTYRELLEELHVLAIGLTGEASYGAAYSGNHFDYTGVSLLTDFTIVNVDATAAQKIAYDLAADTLTVKASNLAGGTAVAQWRNPGGKINLLNGATITGVYEDSDGQRATVTGLDPKGFGITWFLRYRLQGTTTWTEISGTGNTALILLSEGAYDVQVRAPGYDWESDLVLDTTVSLSLNAGLRFQVSANNTPQWEMPFSETLSNAFQYDAVAMAVAVTNTTGAIIQPGFAELYRATQRIQHIPALVWTWVAPVTANATSQKILIPDGNPISMFLTDPSNASVKITCPVIYADTGESADDRVRGNPDGFSIILGSPATAESAGLQAGIVAALGGPNYDSEVHSLALIKSVIDLIKTSVDSTKTTAEALPTLAEVEASEVLAKEATVDAVATAVDALPDAAEIATQVEVSIINDDDGRAVLQAIADKIMAEEISSTVIAQSVRAELAPELALIDVAVSTRSTLTPEDIPEGLTAAQVRTELTPELERIDVAVSTRSTLTAEDIPEGLTAAEVWAAETRTLTESAGLTTEQAAQLANVETLAEALPTLAEIEASTVLAKSAQVEGLPTAAETAAAVLGATVETGATVVQSLRLANAVLGGKVSGGQTGTETFRDLADTKDVVVSTNDAAGNRTAVVKNLG